MKRLDFERKSPNLKYHKKYILRDRENSEDNLHFDATVLKSKASFPNKRN